VWTGCIWLRICPVAGSWEYSNEPSGSIRGEELKKTSALWNSSVLCDIPTADLTKTEFMTVCTVGISEQDFCFLSWQHC